VRSLRAFSDVGKNTKFLTGSRSCNPRYGWNVQLVFGSLYRCLSVLVLQAQYTCVAIILITDRNDPLFKILTYELNEIRDHLATVETD
jgi:hypothetical protein